MGEKYHKIQSLYKRDPDNKFKTFLDGQWAEPAFGYLKDVDWVWTEKVDGTNVRVIWDGERVTFGGRTDNAQMPAVLLGHLSAAFTAELMAQHFGPTPAVLFGEGFGGKIQKGGATYGQEQRFVLFDVWCDMWLERANVVDVAAGQLLCPLVPEVGVGTLAEAVEYVKTAPKSKWGDFVAEGIVLRPKVELRTRRGHRVITKLKVKDFPSGCSAQPR